MNTVIWAFLVLAQAGAQGATGGAPAAGGAPAGPAGPAGPAADGAGQAQPGGCGAGGFQPLIVMALMFAVFYFLLIRPQREQQKKHKALLESLQKGDKIVTSGGMVAEVIHIKDNEVTVKSGESRLVIVRSSVQSITNRTAGEVKEAPKELPKETKPA